jgi:hypothetical protein
MDQVIGNRGAQGNGGQHSGDPPLPQTGSLPRIADKLKKPAERKFLPYGLPRGRLWRPGHHNTIIHRVSNLGAFFAPQKTGLSAPIFAPPGQKFRSYPLRCSKMASMPFLSCRFLLCKNLKIHTAGLHAGHLLTRFW